MFYNTPKLPLALLHTLTVTTIKYERRAGEALRPTSQETKTFKGIVMPITNEDLKLLPEGTYVEDSQKLYTDTSLSIEIGEIVTDTYDGQKYEVKQKLNHNLIHPMNRYLVKGVKA